MGTFYGENGQPIASQANMETATDNTVLVTPLNTNWHPGVAKAWLICDSAGAIQASHNITSITDTGIGIVTVTIATDFSSVNYVINGIVLDTDSVFAKISSITAGSFVGRCLSTAGAADDPTNYFFACFGDQ